MFSSMVTLRLRDNYYETKFIEEKYSFRRKYNIILSLMLTSISISMSICILLQFTPFVLYFSNYYSAIICFITTILSLVITLLSVFITGDRFQEWMSYLNYIIIMFTFSFVKMYFVWALKIDMLLYALIYIIEMVFRLIWFVLGIIDFVPGVYLQVISIVINFILFSAFIPLSYYFRFTVYACILIFTSGLSYFFIREQKRSFYYNMSLKLKNEWYESIIDNMNSGFISIKDTEVQYCNKTLLSFVRKEDGGAALTDNNEASEILNLDINELFDHIIFENNQINAFKQAANILNSKHNEVGDNFVFLGTKDVELSPSCLFNLEVFGRCYSSNHNAIDKYEFIFNDITRSKQIEQKNAEFKYKTLFLSKIAHEFKNPLLCISELVDQVNDNLTKVTMEVIKEEDNSSNILKKIKSLSNYLIILVKDMDYFSQKNTDKKIEKKIDVDKVNLSELIKFCTDIVQALMKKSHKENNINFHVIRENTLPVHITTDEIKLKQILINILSNAVKYTSHGFINLRLTLNDNNLGFQINDTGKGISDSQKENLFTPFSNQFDKLNKYSSGLGLSIVKELLEILGSRIEFDSTVSRGSSFWFTLQLNENDLNNSNITDKTIIGTHFNEQDIQIKLQNNNRLTPEAMYNVIVVDDETIIRQATMRLLYKSFKEKNISINILEASDGLECLYIYYNYIKNGKAVSFILSDETMVYMNGSNTAQVLGNISKSKNIEHSPFYILTAYENLVLGFGKNVIDDVFSKPLRKQYIDEIVKNIK
jgi:signal transduction histidine kinase/CheY-like chemotaxis protein